MRGWLPFLILFLLAQLSSPAAATRITGASITPGTITLAADAPPAAAHHFALAGPYRLVIDLPAALPEPMILPGAGSVVRMRLANFSPGVARLVLDLSGPIEIVSAQASPNGLTIALRRVSDADFDKAVRRGRRPLAVDSGGPPIAQTSDFELPKNAFSQNIPAINPPTPVPEVKPAAEVPALVPPPPPQQLETPVNPPPSRYVAPRSRSGGKPLVVLDAGHGGKDVGAISVNGGYEKDVTLAIVKATARRLERSGKVRVLLTRGDDRFIPLGGRATIARNARADLFISVHADSAPNDQARGASVYTLSSVASDAVAARLAARENKADIIGGVNLGVEAPEVGEIMIDLSRRATGNVSVAFAETLQDALSDKIKFRGEFHHFAGFIVLKAPDVPSVLLETGYVTNSEDAQFLFSDSGRRKVAEGIARAVERHLTGN